MLITSMYFLQCQSPVFSLYGEDELDDFSERNLQYILLSNIFQCFNTPEVA